ncbi:hypothetical protein MFIFM68171_09837 [Madurella fahalii]|uniref:NACHT domain-containing protein n=1 Tax=Madurella fahalii TaxID=1157608 RepID=A0ABQ0GPG6_9PEZI
MAGRFEDENGPCLRDLYITDSEADKQRIEGSKGRDLGEEHHWILNNCDFKEWRDGQNTSLLWINGGPGTGKTMLLCGILDDLSKRNTKSLLSFFFCEASNKKTRSAEAVLRGLLFMLAIKQRSIIKHIRKKYDDAGPGMFEGPSVWYSLRDIFVEVLRDLGSRDADQGVTYLVVDALDECETGLENLLPLIATSSVTTPRVKWLVTSRWQDNIGTGLQASWTGPRLSLRLADHVSEVSNAVEAYIHRRASELAGTPANNTVYQQIRAYLQKRANGSFLHVTLAALELRTVPHSGLSTALARMAFDVQGLYKQAEDRIQGLNWEMSGLCRKALSAVAVAFRPLREQELYALAGLRSSQDEQAKEVLRLCKSFFTTSDGTANLIHQSAKDFLQRDSALFSPGLETEHHRMFFESLRVMETTLRRDMREDALLADEKNKLVAAQYACEYWVEHLVAGGQHTRDTQTEDALIGFLQRQFLYWLEYCARFGNVRESLSSWPRLVGFLKEKQANSELAELLVDAHRFMAYNGQLIMEHPLQVYTSALIFAPTSSRMRLFFQKEEPPWVTVSSGMVREHWSPWLQTLDDSKCGYMATKPTITFSFDNTRLASVLDGRTIKIWNVGTRRRLRTIKGYDFEMPLLAFSPDGTRMASASESGLKIWDSSGEGDFCASRDHFHEIIAIKISAGGMRMVSASRDTVRIWNSGERSRSWNPNVFRDVQHIAISPNGNLLAFASIYGDNIQIWDLKQDKRIQNIPETAVIAPQFSPDGTHVAVMPAGARKFQIKLWDLSGNGRYEPRTFKMHNDPSEKGTSAQPTSACIVFAPDSNGLAASVGNAISVWTSLKEWRRPSLLQANRTTAVIRSLCFLPGNQRLAASHDGGDIRIWDLEKVTCLRVLQMDRKSVDIVSFKETASATFHLLTNTGLISFDLQDEAAPVNEFRRLGYGIDPDNGWITRGDERVLLLPPDYRPRCVAVVPGRLQEASPVAAIVLGCRSGHVVSLRFLDNGTSSIQ